jgi:hypothetical protein
MKLFRASGRQIETGVAFARRTRLLPVLVSYRPILKHILGIELGVGISQKTV